MSAIPRGYLRVRAQSCRMWGPGRRGAAEPDAVGGREVVTTARAGQRQLADEPHGGPGGAGRPPPTALTLRARPRRRTVEGREPHPAVTEGATWVSGTR